MSIHAPSTMSPNARDIAEGATYEPRMIRAFTIVRRQSDARQLLTQLETGLDALTHLSTMGTTIVRAAR